MGDNKKPILSVLVDEDKKRLFADLARANKQSMGWLLNQAIDKMLEYNSIYIYRDSVNPTDGEAPKPLPASDIEEVVRRYVDNAITPFNDDLLSLHSQLAHMAATRALTMEDVTAQCSSRVEIQAVIDRAVEKLRVELADVKQDCDFTTEGVMRLIDDAISKASIGTTTTNKPSAIKTAAAPGDVQPEVLKVANRLEREPELKSAVIDGLTAGHTGEKLGQYLASKGFLNSNGVQYTGASNSRFRLAIEYLNMGEKHEN